MTRDHFHSIQEAGMYNVLSDYYKYTNPELHVYYYHKHLQSLTHALKKESKSAIVSDIQRQNEYGKVRFLQGTNNLPAVDIYMNGICLLREVSFKTMSNELTLPAGKYQLDIYETGKQIDPLSSQILNIDCNAYHTFALAGNERNLTIHSLPEFPIVPANETKLRIIQLAENLPTIDIAVQKGDIVFPSIPYRGASSYLGLFPMTVYLEARNTETKEVLKKFPALQLEADKTYSGFIVEGTDEKTCELLIFSC